MPDHSFQFIVFNRFHDKDFTQGWFSIKHNQTHKSFHLVISSVMTEDTATYYCALNIHNDTGAQEVCTQTPGHNLKELSYRAVHMLGHGILLHCHLCDSFYRCPHMSTE